MHHPCSTHAAAFADFGIDDGIDLVHRTHYALLDGGATPEASSAFADRLARAFRTAFVRSAAVPLVPEAVDAAIEDAAGAAVHRLLDDGDADLRTDVLPAFYRSVARSYCAYRDVEGPDAVGIDFDWDDDGGLPVEA